MMKVFEILVKILDLFRIWFGYWGSRGGKILKFLIFY